MFYCDLIIYREYIKKRINGKIARLFCSLCLFRSIIVYCLYPLYIPLCVILLLVTNSVRFLVSVTDGIYAGC